MGRRNESLFVASGHITKMAATHYANIPICFIPQVSPFLYSRKGEMRGTQNEGLFSGLA